MTPHQKYRAGTAKGWTRIEMLLELYRATAQALDEGMSSGTESVPSQETYVRAQKLLLALLDGLDEERGEPVPSIRRLLIFTLQQVQTRTTAGWRAARKIIETLQEAFEGIAEEAQLLEQSGQIPPLPSGGPVLTALA